MMVRRPMRFMLGGPIFLSQLVYWPGLDFLWSKLNHPAATMGWRVVSCAGEFNEYLSSAVYDRYRDASFNPLPRRSRS
jgi:hypothetical protein